jgi:cytochrome c biogenesis protein CcmG/thiol:disulfide interchange protein DsbE
MRALRVAAVAGVVALLGLLVWDVAHQSRGNVAKAVDRGKIVRAPNFTRPVLGSDARLALASLRGKVVVINFWQSYCPPCRREAHQLAAAARRWRSQGVVFLGVNVQDFVRDANAFVRRYGIRYQSVRDEGPLVGKFGVTGFPETFFVDRRGRIVPPHILGAASKQDLDAGIRRALST